VAQWQSWWVLSMGQARVPSPDQKANKGMSMGFPTPRSPTAPRFPLEPIPIFLPTEKVRVSLTFWKTCPVPPRFPLCLKGPAETSTQAALNWQDAVPSPPARSLLPSVLCLHPGAVVGLWLRVGSCWSPTLHTTLMGRPPEYSLHRPDGKRVGRQHGGK
jgi:hypothetical protein